ncbi:MAG: VOC family protein [Actinomycetota bacterium]|nr:VOC family protein [Actinomycetota bacterium]MDQ6946189.1 VOC family protein [Actinomycetota bacterium]
MEQRMDLVTLGVADVGAARRFYVDGLGWEVAFEVPGDIVFIQVNHGPLIALFGSDALAADAADASDVAGAGAGGAPPVSLAQIVATEDEVRAVWDEARAAGATMLKKPSTPTSAASTAISPIPPGFDGRWPPIRAGTSPPTAR